MLAFNVACNRYCQVLVLSIPHPSLLSHIEEQSASRKALHLHKKHNTVLTDNAAPATFINHVSSFRILPTSFSSCKLVWRAAADPVVPTAYKHSHTAATDASDKSNRSIPPTPTTTRAGAPEVTPTAAAATVASPSAARTAEEDLNLSTELSLELDDEPALAYLRSEAEAAVWARLHSPMALQCCYVQHAVSLASESGYGIGIFPPPTIPHADNDREMAGSAAFLERLMKQWAAESGVPGRNLSSTLNASTGKFGQGPVLGQYLSKLAPILLDGMAHVSREYINYGKKLKEFEEQRVTRPLMMPLKPFNALHCLAAYLVANNNSHDGELSEAAHTLMNTIGQ